MTVVLDQVFLNNSLVEDTYDWFAQDTDGNVWYFGEDSKEIENGVVLRTEGSWKAANINFISPVQVWSFKCSRGQVWSALTWQEFNNRTFHCIT